MSDNNHMEKIQQILLDLSGEAAFSGEAMKQFLELKDEVDSLQQRNDYLRKCNDQHTNEIEKMSTERKCLNNEVAMLKDQIAQMQERERELAGRETQIAILEARVNQAEQRVEDHQNMVGLIFRNTEIKRSTLGQELHYQPGNPEMRDQYGNIQTYHSEPGLVPTDVKKSETETQE